MFTLHKIESDFIGKIGTHYSIIPLERDLIVQDFMNEYQLIQRASGGTQTTMWGYIGNLIKDAINWFK